MNVEAFGCIVGILLDGLLKMGLAGLVLILGFFLCQGVKAYKNKRFKSKRIRSKFSNK
ncbi:MAG: hypothetical protein ACRC3Y_05105 [Romboutsia sp.]|uniref:hypothetical protein n=1 Tax=Romboutsia sp. TaxID=1965302 RepID=UPI003F30A5CE